jgi:hypothetical protein
MTISRQFSNNHFADGLRKTRNSIGGLPYSGFAMKNTLRSLMIFAALAGTVALRAEDVKWDDLCGRAHAKVLTVTTTDGTNASGTCSTQTAFGISLNAKTGVRTVAREDIASIRLDNLGRSHCLAKVRDTAETSLAAGVFSLVTPEFFLSPVFLAGAPVILVGGTPYCAVYDLINRLSGSHEITII